MVRIIAKLLLGLLSVSCNVLIFHHAMSLIEEEEEEEKKNVHELKQIEGASSKVQVAVQKIVLEYFECFEPAWNYV